MHDYERLQKIGILKKEVKDFEQLIGGEIMMYQSYAEEVNANSAVFICDVDGFDDKRLKKIFFM